MISPLSLFKLSEMFLFISWFSYCHKSWPWTLFTRHQRSLTHHMDSCTTLTVATSPKTTFPIIHCTDDTQLISLITHLTRFISLGLPLCDRRVLNVHIATLADSYLTEPFVVFIVLVLVLVWPCFGLCFPLPGLWPCTWIVSLCLALLDTVRRSSTHATPRITLCLAHTIPVCRCLTLPVYWLCL